MSSSSPIVVNEYNVHLAKRWSPQLLERLMLVLPLEILLGREFVNISITVSHY